MAAVEWLQLLTAAIATRLGPPPIQLLVDNPQCCIKYIFKVFQLQNTNYIFKLYFKYFSQLLLKSNTKYKIHLAKVIEILNTFNRIYAKMF